MHLVIESLNIHVPLGLEGVGSGALLAAAKIKMTDSFGAGALHQLPVHEIVGSKRSRFRGGTRIVGQDHVTEDERENACQRLRIRVNEKKVDFPFKFLHQVLEQSTRED